MSLFKIQNKTKVLLTSFIFLGIAFTLFAQRQKPTAPDVPIELFQRAEEHGLTFGNKDAPVHFVLFEDMNCSHCQAFFLSVMGKVKENYIDKGVLKLSIVHLIFLKSQQRAKAADCVYEENQDLYFPFVEKVYKGMPVLEAAEAVNIPSTVIQECTNADYAHYDGNLQYAKELMDKISTPTFFINGRRGLSKSYEGVKRQIEHEIEREEEKE